MSHQMDRNTRNQGNKSRNISPIAQKKPYTAFAGIYDRVMSRAPYREWADMILESYHLSAPENPPKRILDLGCGTCKIWKYLPPNAELWGLDSSHEMLQIADLSHIRGKRVQGDLLELPSLPGKFDLIFSVHDTLNYLLKSEEISRVFSSVRSLLSEKGVFFFDVSTERNFQKNFQGKVLKETHADTKLVWRNEYDPKTRILRTSLEFSDKNSSVQEEHLHRAYPLDLWKSLLTSSGLKILALGSDYESWEYSPKANYWNFACVPS